MAKYDYDLITLGAGSGGVRATRLAGGYGAKTAIVESSRVGGTCVMRGCVPKKLLVYGAHYADYFDESLGFGWNKVEADFDWPTLIKNKNKELDRLEGIYENILKNNKVDLIRGRGKLKDTHTVEVDGKTYTAEKILISVGGWPSMPDIPGIEHVITSNEALDLEKLPKHIIIVGGGYIACEFAGIFNALGVDVKLVIRGDNILRGFDEDIRITLSEEMEKKGISIRRETIIEGIEKTDDGYIAYCGHEESLEADVIMYATGRSPNTNDIGLKEAGVELDEWGAIKVDEWNKTNVDNIYAVGDVTDRIQLTPVAIAEGRAFAETNYNNNEITMDYANVPAAVFSLPPVATVGLTEAEAREKYGEVDVYVSNFRPLKHTLSGHDERSMMKLIVDQKSDKVVGCHMVGDDGPEIIQGMAVAMKCGATKAQVDSTVGLHPTAAEEFVTMRDKRPPHQAKAAE